VPIPTTIRPVPLLASTILRLAIALAGAAPPAGGDSGEIVVGERQPLVMVVFTGKGSEGLTTHISEILQIASEVLKKRTNLVLLSPEQVGADPAKIAACGSKNRFSCWVQTVRSDYERSALLLADGGLMPYSEHLADLKHRGVSYPKYLVALGIYPDPGHADRVSAILINTDEALALFHEAWRKRPDWEERVEDAIFEKGAQARPDSVQVSSASELKTYFEKLFSEEFRPSFEKSGNFEPYGQIDVETAADGLVIDLDGKMIGQSRNGTTRIAEVQPGRRKLGFEDPNRSYQRFEAQIEVKRGGVELVRPLLIREPNTSAARRLTFWGGVGVAAAGVAIASYAAAQKPKSIYLAPCVGGDACKGAPAAGFASFCDLGSGGPECLSGGKGVLVLPLGYSLFAMGAAWAAGSELLEPEENLPWKSLAIGVVLGAAAYGISAAADHK
jgi:hypothetical protein